MSAGLILTLSCSDQPGIVHAVTGFLAAKQLNILNSSQYGDASTNRFFMRIHFAPSDKMLTVAKDGVKQEFQEIADRYQMQWEVHGQEEKPRVLIMVSKIGHCLNDLLFRQSTSQLPIDIPLIVSNHPDFGPLAASYKIPFVHLPVSKDTKDEQETKIMDLIKEYDVELVVLARYMQVLSPRMCKEMSGKIINIHHSFLPSFKGARPYHQAFDRGVKIIGATSHFVTSDLDEGPIIEQDVARVGHALDAKQLTSVGSNVECIVLARAVQYVSERRVLMNGAKTVVFN